MTLENWRRDPNNAIALQKMIASGPLADAIRLLKDRGLPRLSDSQGQTATDHLVLAAASHDRQAGWHDCIRYLFSLASPVKEAVKHDLPQQYDDDYVRKIMAEQGRVLPAPDKVTKKPRK